MALNTLEDWLLFMAGIKDANGNSLGTWPLEREPIRLATYDRKFIQNVAVSIARNVGLTDKQIDLAIKVVTKYQRQWEAIGMDPSYLLTDDIPLAIPMREIDRSTTATISEGMIQLKFPYDSNLINDLHAASSSSCGDWQFDRSSKTWSLSLTEGNLHLLLGLKGFDKRQWQFDDAMKEIIAVVASIDHNDLPHLVARSGKLIPVSVPQQALDSMTSMGFPSSERTPFYWAMVALRHGIRLDSSVMELYPEDSVYNIIMRNNSPHHEEPIRITWNQILELMEGESKLDFVFAFRRGENSVRDRVDGTENLKFFYQSPNLLLRDDHGHGEDPRNCILITDDIAINDNARRRSRLNQFLAAIYISADDGRR